MDACTLKVNVRLEKAEPKLGRAQSDSHTTWWAEHERWPRNQKLRPTMRSTPDSMELMATTATGGLFLRAGTAVTMARASRAYSMDQARTGTRQTRPWLRLPSSTRNTMEAPPRSEYWAAAAATAPPRPPAWRPTDA